MAPIVFRVDGDRSIGLGHIMRCAALAHRLSQMGQRCVFASTASTWDAAADVLRAFEKISLPDFVDVQEESGVLGERIGEAGATLVIDHYGRGQNFEAASRRWAACIVVIDDLPVRPHDCDMLIDPTANRQMAAYQSLLTPTTRCLTGADFALLRPQFVQKRSLALGRRDETQIERIFVSFGGADPHALTSRMLPALLEAFEGSIDVVVSDIYADIEGLYALQRRDGAQRLQIHVGVEDVASLMLRADLAIGAGGGMAWERCCLGLPTVLVEIAENQRDVLATLADAEAGIVQTPDDICDPIALRRLLAQLSKSGTLRVLGSNAARLCDGLGTGRIAWAIAGAKARDNEVVTLRRAAMHDAEQLYAWQAEPETRRFARNTDIPLYDDHVAWLTDKLHTVTTDLFIIEHGRLPAGSLRLDHANDNSAEISIVVGQNHKRMGLAQAALSQAAVLFPDTRMRAFVRPENAASRALFGSLGFHDIKDDGYFELAPLSTRAAAAN